MRGSGTETRCNKPFSLITETEPHTEATTWKSDKCWAQTVFAKSTEKSLAHPVCLHCSVQSDSCQTLDSSHTAIHTVVHQRSTNHTNCLTFCSVTAPNILRLLLCIKCELPRGFFFSLLSSKVTASCLLKQIFRFSPYLEIGRTAFRSIMITFTMGLSSLVPCNIFY